MLEKIALQKGLITKEACEKAVAACKGAQNFELSLKHYFISNELISLKVMNQLVFTLSALKTIRKNARFGQIAVQLGFIKSGDLEAALEKQKKTAVNQKQPKLIGQILIETGLMTKKQVIKVFDIQKTEKQKAQAAARRQIPEETPSTSQDHSLIEELNYGVILEIDSEGMNAYLRKTDSFEQDILVEDILNTLSEKMIQFGIADYETIDGFIRSSGFREKKFQVAKGVSKIQGTDARIEYLFDTDYLKVGGMDAEGKIDFKERGKIPRVKSGTLLAEKLPMVDSRNGRDIFGQVLNAQPAKDIFLSTQTGAWVTPDGTRIYSQVSGFPELTRDGEINVQEVFVVKGDVSFETGHIHYDGDIEVKGCLKNGFCITGHHVKLLEMDGGEIIARDDVIILNGMNNGKIISFGNVGVKFIHQAELECLGNLVVQKEIVDSAIDAGGFCKIDSGEIINTTISAAKGISAKHLGSEKTNPNMVKIGKNLFAQKQKEKLETRLKALQTEQDALLSKEARLIENLSRHNETADLLINEFSMNFALAQKLEARLQAIPDQPDEADTKNQLQKDYKQMGIRLKNMENELENTLDMVRSAIEKTSRLQKDQTGIQKKMEVLRLQQAGIEKWEEANPPEPVVHVNGTVFQDTMIYGRHVQKKIKEQSSHVKIVEAPVSVEGEDVSIYEIQVRDHDDRR